MPADNLTEPFERLLVALLVGMLIGLDRERAEERKGRRLFAGVRTFPLIALVGAVSVILLDLAGPALVVACFVAVAGVALVSYFRASASGDVGATTEIAALATFLLGAMAGAGHLLLAGGTGVAVAVLLAAKFRLERFSRALSEEELGAALELAVISAIVLPLLPNRGFGPWEALNPFALWLVVVLVSALSFAGFVAMRIFGERRGLILAGVLGALVSSTAVTASMAGRARAEERLGRLAAAAAVLASAVMAVRVLAFAVALAPGILPRLAPVVLVMAMAGGLAGWGLARRDSGADVAPSVSPIANPFSLRAAASFGALYGAVLLAVRGAEDVFGSAGVYAVAAISAVVDVDPISLALFRRGAGPTLWRVPAVAVSIALVSNTLVKLGMAVALGRGVFRRAVALALAGMAFAGAAAAVVVFHRP